MNSRLPSVSPAPAWHAALHLAFARTGERTVLRDNRHHGPLRVQKALYPEGEGVCQAIVLHPPSGIAGGDHLLISATVGAGAHAQLTTPGAGKWYRSGGPEASQRLELTVEEGAALEWLPQETIVFSAAQAELQTRIELNGDARLFYWDIVALGRPASGERFEQGHFQARLDIRRDGRPLWHERQRIAGGDGLLDSPIGLDGQPVFATLLVTGEIDDELLERCRALAHPVRGDLSQLPGLLVARCLAGETLQARAWLIALWQLLRPALLGREALAPRIWNT